MLRQSLHDVRLRKRIARTKKWDSKWRRRRCRLERKEKMVEFVRQGQETERQSAEKEIAKVESLLEKVEEITQAPLYVPDKAIDRTRMILREKERGRHLYGVIPSNEERSFGDIGLDKSEVYTIPFRDISLVVSPSPMKDYELTEENTMKYQEVIRHIMNEHTIVPAEFDTVIKDETILKNLMAKSYNTIKECIRLVDGRVELGVKAILKRDQSLTPIEKDEIAKDLVDSLREKAEQLMKGTLFSNRLALNASFLVKKKLMDEFSIEIKRLQEKYADKIDLLYSGPWAPYNFVYIKIGAEGMSFKYK